MATGGEPLSTDSGYKDSEEVPGVVDDKGSEEVFDFTCTPCAYEGKHVEALKFCVDCSEHFCAACTSHHKKFGVTSGHNVVKVDQANQSSVQLPKERCAEHVGERISTYCAEHDVVVCSTCVALEHRSCTGVDYIPKLGLARLDITDDRQHAQNSLSHSLAAVNETKLSIQDRQEKAEAEKKAHMSQIKTYTESLMEHVLDLEKAAITNVDEHHKKTTSGLQAKMDCVEYATTKMKDRLEKLDTIPVASDCQLFVDIKQGKKEAQAAKELAKRLQDSDQGRDKANFAVECSVTLFLKQVTSLGKVILIKPYKAVLKDQFNVELEKEEYYADITDTCLLSDGKLLMADCANDCIKVLDNSNKVIKSFKLQTPPWGICQTSQDTVVVTLLLDKKVQFVNIRGKWKLAKSFNVDDRCRGIAHSNNELLIACGGHQGTVDNAPEGTGFVAIYDMSGTLLRKIEGIFSVPRHIATTKQGTKLHIADEEGGVITVDRGGNVLWTFSLKTAHGICAVSDDSLIVGGSGSQSVLQIDTSGNLVMELLGYSDIRGKLLSVSYAHHSSMLIASFDSEEIKVFDLISGLG